MENTFDPRYNLKNCPANVSRLDLHGRMCGLYQDDCKYPHREECPRYRTEVIPRRNSSTTS